MRTPKPAIIFYSRLTVVAEQAETNRKRPKIEGAPNPNPGGSSSIGISATVPFLSGVGKTGATGSGTATSSEQSTYTSPSSHDSSTTFHPQNAQSISPCATKPATLSSPRRRSGSPSDVARYRDAVLKTTQQQQEVLVAPTTDTEPPFFPRIHPTIQSPHIQQQPSFLRHQPPPIGAQAPLSRPGPPVPNPAIRRSSIRSEEVLPPTPASLSSSGSSSAPSLTPSMSTFDDSGRSHRSLPSLPPPTPGPTSGPGYFDQRPHHPQPPPRSPRPFPHHQNFSPQTLMGHPSHPNYHSYQSTSQLPTINQSTHEPSTTTPRDMHQSPQNPKPPSGR